MPPLEGIAFKRFGGVAIGAESCGDGAAFGTDAFGVATDVGGTVAVNSVDRSSVTSIVSTHP